jgi:hypothetical protein
MKKEESLFVHAADSIFFVSITGMDGTEKRQVGVPQGMKL